MRKIMIRAMALILAAILVLSLIPVALAAENINFGVTVTEAADKILVTVAEGNDAAFAELEKENKLFALTVPCEFTAAYVTCGGTIVQSRLNTADKTIQFAVAKSGEYQILQGEAPKKEPENSGNSGGSTGSTGATGATGSGNSGGSEESGSSSTSSRKTTGTVTAVPVQGEDKTVWVEASVSGTVASLEKLSVNQVHAVVNDKVQTGVVTVDLSVLDQTVDSVKLPATVLEQITEAANSNKNDTEALEIVLSKGISVELNGQSLAGLSEAAENRPVVISVKDHKKVKTLTAEQKAAVGSCAAYDITVSASGTEISQIGGRITIRVPYSLKAGETAEGLQVYYVDGQGNRHLCESSYNSRKKEMSWHTDHLSVYMIDYEAPSAAEAATEAAETAETVVQTQMTAEEPQQAAAEAETAPAHAVGNNLLLWICIICSALALILLGVLIYFRKKW